MNRIAVFCGSQFGSNNSFKENAYLLGKTLASQDLSLVYGGSRTGLMGEIAKGVLDENGKVIGVIPTFLIDKELAHNGLTELIHVETMHERKAKMNEISQGFIILPGGIGTMEEFFEVFTWAQLGLHRKPIVIFNIDGAFNSLLNLISQLTDLGFINENSKDLYTTCDSIEAITSLLNNHLLYFKPRA